MCKIIFDGSVLITTTGACILGEAWRLFGEKSDRKRETSEANTRDEDRDKS